MTKVRRWAWVISLVAFAGAGLVLTFLLSITTNDRAFYERHYVWLFWVNVAVAAFLVLIIGIAAVRLLLRVQRGKFGSRLLLKLAAIFALVGVVPGVVIYTVSFQFVSRSIESWFDVKVEGALDAGLNLGRGVIDAQVNDLADKTRLAAGGQQDLAVAADDGHFLCRELLARDELDVLELINGRNSVKDIARRTRTGTFAVSRIVYRLSKSNVVRRRVMPVTV